MNQKETAIEFIERRTFKAEDSNPSLKMVAVNDVLEAINIASAPGWIEVSEPPKYDDQYLCCAICIDANGDIHRYKRLVDYDTKNGFNTERGEEVTHYLPIIALPEPKKKI